MLLTILENSKKSFIERKIKNKNHHQLIHYIDGVVYTKRFWHSVLKPYQIHNDTGAGDAFAGGLIAGILSKDMLSKQEAAIRLGAIAASARMRTKTEPFERIHNATSRFLREKQRNEQLNLYQKVRLEMEAKQSVFIGILTAIITGVISSYIWEIILH